MSIATLFRTLCNYQKGHVFPFFFDKFIREMKKKEKRKENPSTPYGKRKLTKLFL